MNMLAELAREKQYAKDAQIFTYTKRVFVPNTSYHAPSQFNPSPMAIPGKARLRFRCEEDAHFKITAITATVHGPVAYNPSLPEDEQLTGLDPQGGTVFPLPGLCDPLPKNPVEIIAVGANTITLAAGYGPYRQGHPIMFAVGSPGVLPPELATGRLYYIDNPSGDVIQVSLYSNGAGTINFSGVGSGTFYAVVPLVVSAVATPEISVYGGYTVRLGQPVTLIAYAPALVPAPLVSGREYYAIPNGSAFYLAETPQGAIAGTAITLTDGGTADSVYVFPKANRAERGVSVGIMDRAKTDRILTSDGSGSLGFVPIECLFPPAYGTSLPAPFQCDYILPKQHELLLEFRNRDTAGGMVATDSEIGSDCNWCHVVELAFHGYKFYD